MTPSKLRARLSRVAQIPTGNQDPDREDHVQLKDLSVPAEDRSGWIDLKKKGDLMCETVGVDTDVPHAQPCGTISQCGVFKPTLDQRTPV